VATLVTAEWDHPDVFADDEAVVAAFAAWLRATAGSTGPPVLVANLGNAGVRAVVERVGAAVERVVGFRLAEADHDPAGTAIVGSVETVSPDGTRLAIRGLPDGPAVVELRVAGRHNAENALAVAATALTLGLSGREIVAGLEEFSGASRRLELKGEPGGVAVLDDYGHHPTAIAATLAAARQRFPGRRLWAVYEPLTYHRTAAMLTRFADVLAVADRVAIADIWAGRDPDTSVTSASALADEVGRRRKGIAEATGSVEATAARLAGEVERGDVVVVMGGGRSYRIAELLVAALAARPPLH
jgi:UDP-N-acetylmuramate--alanine ligase